MRLLSVFHSLFFVELAVENGLSASEVINEQRSFNRRTDCGRAGVFSSESGKEVTSIYNIEDVKEMEAIVDFEKEISDAVKQLVVHEGDKEMLKDSGS